MTEFEVLLEQIAKLLECPVDWDRIVVVPAKDADQPPELSNPGLCTEMKWYWHEIAKQCEVDGEAFYIGVLYPTMEDGDLSFMYEEGDEERMRSDLKNIETWIQNARSQYIEKTRPIAEMKMATNKDQQKHYPLPSLSASKIRDKTNNGASLFYNGIQAALPKLLWSVLEECWREVVDTKHFKIYVDCINVIGASHGQDSRHALLDMDCSTPITHAYPVTEQEITKEDRILIADDLQGVAIVDD